MALSILVEASRTLPIDGLSWDAIFAGTFPDRRFHALAREQHDGFAIIEHRLSPALELIFHFQALGPESAELAGFLANKMPSLLNIYDDEDEDERRELDEEVFPEDFIALLGEVREYAARAPGTIVGTTTLAGLRSELDALFALVTLAETNVYSMRINRDV